MLSHALHRAVFAASVLTSAHLVLADYPSYQSMPYAYTLDPSRFASLFSTAQTQTVRVAVLGDSQETSPGGCGNVYMPRLNYQAAQYFNNAPETTFANPWSFGGGGYPGADWLIAGSAPGNSGSTTRLASNQLLPGISPATVVAINAGNNIFTEYYGRLTLLEQDAYGIDPAAQIPTTPYFKTDGVVRAQIFAATNPSSGGLFYQAKPTDGTSTNYFVTPTTSGTLNMNLQSSTPAIVSAYTDPLDFAGHARIQVDVSGTDPNVPTDYIGLRFHNDTHPEGMTFTSIATGGYTARSFLDANSNAGSMYAALGFDAAILHYGANDAGQGYSAEQFKANELQIIDELRQWTADPNYRVILMADVARTNLDANQQAQLDQYTGALLSLTQSDPNLLVINSRRLMDDIGWNTSDPNFNLYCADGVHYTALGAQDLAQAEFSALASIANPEPSTLALLAIGSALLMRRRARS